MAAVRGLIEIMGVYMDSCTVWRELDLNTYWSAYRLLSLLSLILPIIWNTILRKICRVSSNVRIVP